MARPRIGPPPSEADLEAIANAALAELPATLLAQVRGIAILIEDFADDETLEEMGLESPYDLLGLYHGVSLDQQSVGTVRQDLDRIFLYRGPILHYWCESGETLEAVVRNTLIHEIGHHVGLSDEDMERLEAAED
jgi:predicted Zn-dependent protease with MMP-like domain